MSAPDALPATNELGWLPGGGQMARTVVEPSTGDLLVGGKRVFPIGLSDPPPVGSTAPNNGLPAWAEIARAGVSFVRSYTVWTAAEAAEQLLAVGQELDVAQRHGLQVWLALAGIDSVWGT
jgi:hypothetical protein